jgi:hypothetical protein
MSVDRRSTGQPLAVTQDWRVALSGTGPAWDHPIEQIHYAISREGGYVMTISAQSKREIALKEGDADNK